MEGGEGATKGGSEDRSRESGVPVPLEDFDIPLGIGEVVGDAGGDMVRTATIVLALLLKYEEGTCKGKSVDWIQAPDDQGFI